MPLSMATSQIQMEKWLGMPVRAFKQAKVYLILEIILKNNGNKIRFIK